MISGYNRDFILTIEFTLESIKQNETSSQPFPFQIGKKLLEYYLGEQTFNLNVLLFKKIKHPIFYIPHTVSYFKPSNLIVYSIIDFSLN